MYNILKLDYLNLDKLIKNKLNFLVIVEENMNKMNVVK